jgi:hypothetical protein
VLTSSPVMCVECEKERTRRWYPTPVWNQVLVFASRLIVYSFRTPGFFLTRVGVALCVFV